METSDQVKDDDVTLNGVKRLICDHYIFLFGKRYEAALKEQNAELGFNLFELISEHYYRETFHTHILQSIFDPSGKHGAGNRYLQLFLEFIRSEYDVRINPTDYLEATVLEENGRVDILIVARAESGKARKAIIVENKINDALDQPMQLPSYLRYVEDECNCHCEAIIYLRRNSRGHPSRLRWDDDPVLKKWAARVDQLLTVIPAYAGHEVGGDLLKGWVEECEAVSIACSDAQHILRQYGKIIRKIGGNTMNEPIMEEFYEFVTKDGNFASAVRLKKMLVDLIEYRRRRIQERFTGKVEARPFAKVYLAYDRNVVFEGFHCDEARFGIDIIVEEELTEFQFWDKNDRGGETGFVKNALRRMQRTYGNDDFKEGGIFKKIFSFPSGEMELLDYVKKFKEDLATAFGYAHIREWDEK